MPRLSGLDDSSLHTLTVVANSECQRLLAVGQLDLDASRLCVHEGITHRLATNVQYLVRGYRVQRNGLPDNACMKRSFGCMEKARTIRTQLRSQLLRGRVGPAQVEHSSTPFRDDVTPLREGVVQFVARCAVWCNCVRDCMELEHQPLNTLQKSVVQVSCDALTLTQTCRKPPLNVCFRAPQSINE